VVFICVQGCHNREKSAALGEPRVRATRYRLLSTDEIGSPRRPPDSYWDEKPPTDHGTIEALIEARAVLSPARHSVTMQFATSPAHLRPTCLRSPSRPQAARGCGAEPHSTTSTTGRGESSRQVRGGVTLVPGYRKPPLAPPSTTTISSRCTSLRSLRIVFDLDAALRKLRLAIWRRESPARRHRGSPTSPEHELCCPDQGSTSPSTIFCSRRDRLHTIVGLSDEAKALEAAHIPHQCFGPTPVSVPVTKNPWATSKRSPPPRAADLCVSVRRGARRLARW